jgi:uncharacterized membrane protein YgcG
VPGGEPFDERQLTEIVRATRTASERSGVHFSVFVGRSEGDPQVYASRLLGALDDADNSVVVLVDPAARRLEIATGHLAAKVLDDNECGLTALSMTSSFTGGDLVGGVVTGMRMLGDSVVL